MNNNYIELKPNKIYGIPLANGILRVDVSCDEDYPGLDIEFIPNNENIKPVTRPRVLIEAPINENGTQDNLRALVWANEDSEDYSDEIIFSNKQLNKGSDKEC